MECHRRKVKKLEQAGLWFAGSVINKQRLAELDNELEEAVFMGMNKEHFKAEQYERQEIKDLELFQENIPVFQMFNKLQTQINYIASASAAIPTGLNYSAVWDTLDRYFDAEEAKEIFEDLQVLEQSYLRAKHHA